VEKKGKGDSILQAVRYPALLVPEGEKRKYNVQACSLQPSSL